MTPKHLYLLKNNSTVDLFEQHPVRHLIEHHACGIQIVGLEGIVSRPEKIASQANISSNTLRAWPMPARDEREGEGEGVRHVVNSSMAVSGEEDTPRPCMRVL